MRTRQYPQLPPMTACPECGNWRLTQELRVSRDGINWETRRTYRCHPAHGVSHRCCNPRKESA